MPDVIEWPERLLKHTSASYFLQPLNRSAGMSIIGREQIISPGASFWRASLSISRQLNGAYMKEFDAYITAMQGRWNFAQFKICDPFKFGARRNPKAPFTDHTWFSDGTGFDDLGSEPVYTTASAAVGSIYLSLDLKNPTINNLRVGDEFSHNYFLYRVTSADSAGNISFLPPLRQGIASGEQIILDPPVIRMRFATDDEGVREREALRFGSEITLNFVEVFER